LRTGVSFHLESSVAYLVGSAAYVGESNGIILQVLRPVSYAVVRKLF